MRFLLAIVISLAVPRPLPALAAVAPEPLKASIDTDDVAFPRPPTVRRQVRFWEKVFLKYPSTTVIIHDALEPDRIVDLIDYKAFATRDKLDEPAPRGEREQVTRKYLRRYARAVERFKKFGEKPPSLAPLKRGCGTSIAAIPRRSAVCYLVRCVSGAKQVSPTSSTGPLAWLSPICRAWSRYSPP